MIHELTQGTDAWHQFRLEHFGASEAAAMLGLSSNVRRTELLHMKHTGTAKEFSDWVQENILDHGHDVEALARPLAEEIAGEDFYPVTCSDGTLSASCDGLTMSEEFAFEHKQWNAALAASVAEGILPDEYMPQCQQIMLVTGASKVLFVVSDGTRKKMEHMWVEADPAWFDRIVAGWLQFARDLESYVPAPVEMKSVGRTPETLPALRLEVTGMVTASNLAEFKEHALTVFGNINRELTTDQEFADAEKTIKWCSEVESRLVAAKEHALSQTQSIDMMFKMVDDIVAESKAVRLALDKLVTRRKVEVKESILAEGKGAYREHIDGLIVETGGAWIALPAPDFVGAAKGKRTLSSMKDAVDTVLANAKIEADASAKRIRAALACIKDGGAGFEFLFADRMTLISKPIDDLQLVVKTRIAEHQAAEAARQEAERTRIQEEERVKAEAKVQAEQQANVPAAVPSPEPIVGQQHSTAIRPGPIGPIFSGPVRRAVTDNRPPITTGALCALAGDGFTMTAAFIQSLGFIPEDRPKEAKSGTYWAAGDVPTIFNAMARRFSELAGNETALAA
jgi:predicted phage-related endonuclease